MYRYPRLPAALTYAAEAHSRQVRKGTDIPYVSHPIGVASLVLEHGGDEDQAIAGLLHDVLEDCGAEHEGPIRAAFGERVAAMVLDCTDGVPDGGGDKAPWRDRKLAYLRHLETVDAAPLLVSACDKLHNARAIASDAAAGQDVFVRFKAGREGTLWYYGSLVEVIGRRLGEGHPLARELAGAVARMSAAYTNQA